MASNSLSLPIDIPWERWCVSDDMIDLVPCDTDRPAKWQSSIAVFRYVPEDDYQGYPGRKITYLKVVCTISGFQPKEDEVQGIIDNLRNSFEAGSLSQNNPDNLLSFYKPCNEAILQVTVAPPPKSDIPKDDYPYIMDFQPKKRELYEAVTDTKELMSRSLESLNIGKSAGSTESQEVLDVDQGYNVGVNAQGYGVSYGQQGQWGTKQIGTGNSGLSRTTDESHERRETVSHTTQLTQLRHLLDSYHLGTNRVVFFIQPRPNTLQEPSGFVAGPRPIEGIQEFFLIVNQPKDQKDFCVDVRLDTGHLLESPKMDYDRTQTTIVDSAGASAPAPSSNKDGVPDPGSDIDVWLTGLSTGWYIKYHCRKTQDTPPVTTYQPQPINNAQYLIDINKEGNPGEWGYKTLSNPVFNDASSTVQVSPNTLTINCQAFGSAYFKGDFLDMRSALGTPPPPGDPFTAAIYFSAADIINVISSSVARSVEVFLISRDTIVDTKQKERVFFITTRGLCCCPAPELHTKEGIVYIAQLSGEVAEMNVQQANALQTAMRQEMLQSLVSVRRTDPKPLAETPLLTKMLLPSLLQDPVGRIYLKQSCANAIPEKLAAHLSKSFREKVNQITRLDLLTMNAPVLAKVTGLDEASAHQLKVAMLTASFKAPRPPEHAKAVQQPEEKSSKSMVPRQGVPAKSRSRKSSK